MKSPKHIVSSFILLIVISGKLSAQDETSSPKKFSMGLGIDIETLYRNFYFEPTANVTLTVDLFDFLRLEPEIGYNKEDHYNNYDNLEYTSIGVNTGVGGFWLFRVKNVTPYVGLRYSRKKYEYIREYPSTSTYEHYIKDSNFGPILGVEYRFTEHFSLGADIGYYWYKRSDRNVDNNSDQTSIEKGNTTASRIKFRFYFF
jgi:hypothetical protein